jgi:ABC-type branched-subunit amino acid transport system substrate-binding protein
MFLLTCTAGVAMLFSVVVRASRDAPSGLPATIKIGVLTSLSGKSAGSCTAVLVASKLAAQRSNYTVYFGSGVHVQIVSDYDGSVATGAVTGFNDLASQGVAGIVGPCLAEAATAIVPLVAKAQIPAVTQSANTDLPHYPFMFHGSASELHRGYTVEALRALHIKTRCICVTDSISVAQVFYGWKPALSVGSRCDFRSHWSQLDLRLDHSADHADKVQAIPASMLSGRLTSAYQPGQAG